MRNQRLVANLKRCVDELERLHYLHYPMFAGKVGEPNKRVIRDARRALQDRGKDKD